MIEQLKLGPDSFNFPMLAFQVQPSKTTSTPKSLWGSYKQANTYWREG